MQATNVFWKVESTASLKLPTDVPAKLGQKIAWGKIRKFFSRRRFFRYRNLYCNDLTPTQRTNDLADLSPRFRKITDPPQPERIPEHFAALALARDAGEMQGTFTTSYMRRTPSPKSAPPLVTELNL